MRRVGYRKRLDGEATLGVARLALCALVVILAAAACSSGTGTAGHTASTAAGTAKLSVTSTLDGHATLPQRISWVATPSVPPSDVAEVDFLIDGPDAGSRRLPQPAGNLGRGVELGRASIVTAADDWPS